MTDLVQDRLPNFTEEQVKMLKGSCDYIGLNHYYTKYAHRTFEKGHDFGTDSMVW